MRALLEVLCRLPARFGLTWRRDLMIETSDSDCEGHRQGAIDALAKLAQEPGPFDFFDILSEGFIRLVC